MKIFAALLAILLSFKSFAEVPVDPLISLCVPYPEIKNSHLEPTKFNTTNNLARSSESGFYQAEGQRIVVYGRLMDANCVPVNDGKIFIWQANKEGYIQYKTEKHEHAKWIDPNFDGTGITNSDNMGRFNFITILPGSAGRTTPHINIMVEHRDLKTLHSKIYFPRDGKTRIHDDLSGKIDQARVTAAPGKMNAAGIVTEYFIDITLPEKIPYKEY